MYDEKSCDDSTLKLDNLIEYYLKNFDNPEIMSELEWDNPSLYRKICRIHYVHSIQCKDNLSKCPDCRSEIIQDEWGEEYCSECGLVTRSYYDYVAGQKVQFPYGLK